QLSLPATPLGVFEVVIYGFMGQPVRRLLRGKQSNGNQALVWDGKDDVGQLVPVGKYWFRVKTDKRVYSKMLIVAH
ncbi:MAG: FlgD immunoglobulin-like domain containing protein, partial [candidate division KSB1 bacterium]